MFIPSSVSSDHDRAQLIEALARLTARRFGVIAPSEILYKFPQKLCLNPNPLEKENLP